MVLVPCVVLQVNILHHHLDLQVQDRLLVHLLGLLRLVLVHLVLVLLVIGIGIIGWEGMEWIFHLLLLGMIDQGRLLVLWDDMHIVEAGMDVETHVTEADMEDSENMFFFFFVFFLILLAHFCLILNFIYLQIKPRQPTCYISSDFFLLIEK